MDTANMIAAIAGGGTITTKKKGTCKGQQVELTVTTTAPAELPVTVVDETVTEEQTYTKLPVDAGKRTVEVLPGVKLISYSKGYVCLKMKGKGWNGQKTELGKPLYRDDLIHLANAILAEAEGAKSYDEAHGNVEMVPF